MSIKVKLIKPEFVDKRGYISRLVDDNEFHFTTVLYITSKANTIRGNHYHKKDYHYLYCVSGKFKYTEKTLTKKRPKFEWVILKPGDLVLSRPMIAHAMEFLEDTIFLAITTEPREQDLYEGDTVRVKIV